MADKQAYIDKMEGRLDTWKGKFDQLKGKMKESGADAQIKYQDELESLKTQMSMMENRVNEMKAAGEDKMNEMTDKVDTMWNEFKSNFEKIDTSVGQ